MLRKKSVEVMSIDVFSYIDRADDNSIGNKTALCFTPVQMTN